MAGISIQTHILQYSCQAGHLCMIQHYMQVYSTCTHAYLDDMFRYYGIQHTSSSLLYLSAKFLPVIGTICNGTAPNVFRSASTIAYYPTLIKSMD